MENSIGERLSQLLNERAMAQSELSRLTNISKGSISGYVNGTFKPKDDNAEAIAKALCVSVDYLLGKTDNPSRRASRAAIDAGVATNLGAVRIPVVSEIAAGVPIEAMENTIDDDDPSTWEEIPREWVHGDKQFVALRVSGVSMEPQIPDGSIAIIEKCYEWHNGKIMAVYVNGYNATLKRVRVHENGTVVLEANNTDACETKIYTPDEVKNLPVKPCGILRQTRIEW